MSLYFRLSCLLAVLCFSLGLYGQGQSFPVTAVVQSLPPFTPSLSDWADPSANRLGVTLLLNDAEEPSYQVRLRLKISGQGIEMRTRPSFQPRPITLNFGQAVQLTAADLREYFEIDNLDFIGYSRQAYLDAGGVPGGTYSLCFEAIDYDRADEEAASREACTFVQARLLDPPVILSPLGQVAALNPQNLIVQWQARHTASFVTNYDVEIFAADPSGGLTPEQIFTIQQPYVETTTIGLTTTLIDNSFPTLAQGQEYFMRVRAYDANGSDAFKNDGFSELAFFTYGEACAPPGGITASVGGHDNAAIDWQPMPGSNGYVVRVKENNPVAAWYEHETAIFSEDLNDLSPDTEYLVAVQSVCGGTPGTFSESYAFTTDTLPFDPGSFECGVAVDSFVAPGNTTPLASLPFGTIVTIGGFRMKITYATQVFGDLWKGTGQVLVPFLGKSINVKFAALGVNTDRYVYKGNAYAKGKIEDGPGVKSPKTIAEEEADGPPRDFCDSLITASTPTASGSGTYTIGRDAYDSGYNSAYDNYNPNNTYASYSPDDYTDVNNPYTEERPFPSTSLWNPYNVFSPYDPKDYTNPINPWTATFPYDGELMLDKAALPSASDIPSTVSHGAANLPQGIGVANMAILIDQMQFTPTVAKLWTYASAYLPVADKTVSFRGKGITFHPEGLQGESKMMLNNDLVFTFRKEIKMIMKKGKKTYVAFDCNGLTGVGFDMTAEFCEYYVRAVDPATRELKPGRVKFSVSGVADDWTQMSAEVSIPPFALTKMPDWQFSVTSAVIDFSESTTPAGVTFPRFYQHPKVSQTNNYGHDKQGKFSPEWMGLYLGELTVQLPKSMARDTNNPITIGAYGMLIDEVGLTLNVYGTNLIPLERDVTRRDTNRNNSANDDDMILPPGFFEGEGGFDNATTNNSGVQASTANNPQSGASAGSWDLSLDRLGIGIQYSKFKYVAFTGKVVVPVFKDPLRYAAHIQPPSDTTRGLTFSSAYSFHVGLTDTVKFEAMGAKLELHANSSIGINYDGRTKQFYADAVFNGLASFNPSLSGSEQNAGSGTSGAGSGAGAGAGTVSGTTPSTDTTSANRFNVPQIRFQNFQVQSKEPYIPSIGSWSLEGDTQPEMGGFNVTFNEVGMFSKIISPTEMEVAFGVDLTLNLTPSEEWGFGAGGKAYIISKVVTDSITKRQDWTFKKVRVDKLTVDYEGPAFKLKGLIKFYENKPVWGTGFKGGISLAVQPDISVAAVVQFGNIDGHRYFFADAKVGFTPGLPLGTTGMAIYGFGGGVSYGMKRQGRSSMAPVAGTGSAPTPPPSPAVTPPADPELDIPAGFFEGEGGFQDPATQPTAELPAASSLEGDFSGESAANTMPPMISIPEALGVSLSGARYTPDPTMGIGIKALLSFGTTKPEVFNGDLMLEAVFTSSGGIATIALTGNANVMTPLKTPENPNPVPQLAAYMDMQYDFIEEAFDAMLEVKVYAAEGVLRGAYPNYVAGVGTVHADANDWWVYMGTPTNPFMLDLDVTELANMSSPGANNNNNETSDSGNGGDTDDDEDNSTSSDSTSISLGQIGDVGLLVKAYFDAGTIIPAFPSVPDNVLAIMPNITRPDANDAAGGGGIMGGLHYQVSMPDLRFLIFFADLGAGMGADVMMRNYGPEARCAGNPDADGPIGFNGWYGTGQAYAYMSGSVGLEIKFFGTPTKFEIATIGAAAVLQTRLPNPIWIKGQLAGNYSILGGALSGRFDFEFEAGEKCDIINARTLDGFQVISGLTPEDEETDVNVFAKPQATFNFPVDAAPLLYKNDSGEYQYAKPKMTDFYLQDAEGNDIPGEVLWAQDKYSVLIKSDEILPPNTELTLGVQIRFQTRPANGTDADYTWLMRGVNTFEEENETVIFTTGGAPTNIPEENILYAYPMKLQTNFHPRQSPTGYVQLDRGQGYLFLGQPGANISAADYEQKIRFKQVGGANVNYDVTYNAGERKVSFTIPPNMVLDKISSYQIVNIPVGEEAAVGVNVDSVRREVDLQLPEGADPNTSEVVVRSMEAMGLETGLQETEIYGMSFRTSRYATFGEKINDFVNEVVTRQMVPLTTSEPRYLDDGSIFTPPILVLYNLLERFDQEEGFDGFELSGDPLRNVAPLMSLEADLSRAGGSWFADTIQPYIYDPFPFQGIALTRPELPLGIPPSFALNLRMANNDAPNALREEDVINGFYGNATASYMLNYQVPYRVYSDFGDLKQQLLNRLSSNGSATGGLGAAQLALLNWVYPPLGRGTYRVNFRYRLPGDTNFQTTVAHDFNFNNGSSK